MWKSRGDTPYSAPPPPSPLTVWLWGTVSPWGLTASVISPGDGEQGAPFLHRGHQTHNVLFARAVYILYLKEQASQWISIMREPGHITHVDSPYIVPRGDKSAPGDMNMQWQSVWLLLARMHTDAQFIPLPHSKQKNKTNEPQHRLINSILLSTKKCSSAFSEYALKRQIINVKHVLCWCIRNSLEQSIIVTWV